jgi:Icc-related predicted phosphoesterase
MALFRTKAAPRVGAQTASLYYASDLHGSEPCWRKFVGAAKFYGPDALIIGGDLVGKAIVPIEQCADGAYRTRFLGEDRTARGEAALEALESVIRFNGMYPWTAGPSELTACAEDKAAQSRLFDEVVAVEFARWLEIVEHRTGAPDAQFYAIAGNDDPWFLDAMLEHSPAIEFCDDRVVIVSGHEMISLSYSNVTPWNSPRELPEDELYVRLKALAAQLEAPERAIFNLHVPPYDSGLDRAAHVNADLSIRYRGGRPDEGPVGSTAVREIIEEYQPLLALHGHIHESRGRTYIGKTLAINSGSEYNTGRLHGAIVELASDAVVAHQFVVG